MKSARAYAPLASMEDDSELFKDPDSSGTDRKTPPHTDTKRKGGPEKDENKDATSSRLPFKEWKINFNIRRPRGKEPGGRSQVPLLHPGFSDERETVRIQSYEEATEVNKEQDELATVSGAAANDVDTDATGQRLLLSGVEQLNIQTRAGSFHDTFSQCSCASKQRPTTQFGGMGKQISNAGSSADSRKDQTQDNQSKDLFLQEASDLEQNLEVPNDKPHSVSDVRGSKAIDKRSKDVYFEEMHDPLKHEEVFDTKGQLVCDVTASKTDFKRSYTDDGTLENRFSTGHSGENWDRSSLQTGDNNTHVNSRDTRRKRWVSDLRRTEDEGRHKYPPQTTALKMFTTIEEDLPDIDSDEFDSDGYKLPGKSPPPFAGKQKYSGVLRKIPDDSFVSDFECKAGVDAANADEDNFGQNMSSVSLCDTHKHAQPLSVLSDGGSLSESRANTERPHHFGEQRTHSPTKFGQKGSPDIDNARCVIEHPPDTNNQIQLLDTNNTCDYTVTDIDQVLVHPLDTKNSGSGSETYWDSEKIEFTPYENDQGSSSPEQFGDTRTNTLRAGFTLTHAQTPAIDSSAMEYNFENLQCTQAQTAHKLADKEKSQKEGITELASDPSEGLQQQQATNKEKDPNQDITELARDTDIEARREKSEERSVDFEAVASTLGFIRANRRKRRRVTRVRMVAFFLKYCLFFLNFFFWMASVGAIVTGAYVLSERGQLVRESASLFLDPSFMTCLVGAITFVVAFIGCLGALRENICLLRMFQYSMIAVLILEAMIGAMVFAFYAMPEVRDHIKAGPEQVLKMAIRRYHDDAELQRWIDLIQREFKCCGASHSDSGYVDWTENPYFNCTPTNPSSLRCGVPLSCCIIERGEYINHMCGFDTINKMAGELFDRIYTQGCMKGLGKWLASHDVVIGAVCLAIIVPQILCVVFARLLIQHVQRQRVRWRVLHSHKDT